MEDQAYQLFVTSDPLIAGIIRKKILRVGLQSEARTKPHSVDISHLYKSNALTDNSGNIEVQDGEDKRSDDSENEDNGGDDGGSEGSESDD
ncbi:hypothetical protein FJT64_006637 [Amphibalanus amphitrite]|uniref:Uncharacterized protein n=1 Tax=Amphibalanus amphitrite TaxID=1232801 RepID=A0A6A4VMW3_AMPAM|nr:hypothetical protein FJT64_006637 [Amphibalanus amphitrite]